MSGRFGARWAPDGDCVVVDNLLRTLARGPPTTGEPAHFWELSPPEVSRHLAVLRRTGLLTTRRHGRYVHYTLNLPEMTTLGGPAGGRPR